MLLRKTFFGLLVSLLLAVISTGGSDAQTVNQDTKEHTVVLKWLGNAVWEIEIGQTIVLIDPFLTRGLASAGKEKTDKEAVRKAIKGADYIFAGHSHADHIADIPFIAKKFGSKLIGSQTTTNIALTGGVDKSQLVTISGGEKLDLKEFSVQVIESEHGALVRSGRRRRPKFEEVTKPLSGPIMGDAFVEAGSYLYYFTSGKHRLLHQSTGDFIEDKLSGLKPDTALLYPMARDEAAAMLKALQPKTVLVHHFDEWRAAFSEGIPESKARRAQRFARDVAASEKQIKVIIPKLFELSARLAPWYSEPNCVMATENYKARTLLSRIGANDT